jgi:uncharacterized SAM-binding protein YcdF (DUF218 family)
MTLVLPALFTKYACYNKLYKNKNFMKNNFNTIRQKPNASIAVTAYHLPRSSNFFRKQLAKVIAYDTTGNPSIALTRSTTVNPLLYTTTLPETGSEKKSIFGVIFAYLKSF